VYLTQTHVGTPKVVTQLPKPNNDLSPSSSPNFSSHSPYLLLLSSRATELRLATTITWSDGMRWWVLQVRERGPIYSLRWSKGYSIATSAIRVIILLHPWMQPTLNRHKWTHHIAPLVLVYMFSKDESVC
jgi:hypothetical protein